MRQQKPEKTKGLARENEPIPRFDLGMDAKARIAS